MFYWILDGDWDSKFRDGGTDRRPVAKEGTSTDRVRGYSSDDKSLHFHKGGAPQSQLPTGAGCPPGKGTALRVSAGLSVFPDFHQ